MRLGPNPSQRFKSVILARCSGLVQIKHVSEYSVLYRCKTALGIVIHLYPLQLFARRVARAACSLGVTSKASRASEVEGSYPNNMAVYWKTTGITTASKRLSIKIVRALWASSWRAANLMILQCRTRSVKPDFVRVVLVFANDLTVLVIRDYSACVMRQVSSGLRMKIWMSMGEMG